MLERVRLTEPATYLRVASVLVPKEMKVEVDQRSGPLDSGEMRTLRRLVDMVESCAPGAGPEILDDIEEYLRARNAKEIGSNGSNPVAIEHLSTEETEFVQSVSETE